MQSVLNLNKPVIRNYLLCSQSNKEFEIKSAMQEIVIRMLFRVQKLRCLAAKYLSEN